MCALTPGGGYAEYCVVDAGSCLPIPDGLGLPEAAALPEACFTVWANVFELGRLQAGETILVHGGTSGVGSTAVQLAKARAGVRTMLNLEVRRALNSWKSARQALQPVLRGIAHWRNAPVKKAFNSMCANVRRREYMRAVLFRLQHLLVGKAVRTWQAKIASGLLKRLTRLGAAWVHWPKRKALNTWFAYYRGQRRLRGLVHTFQGTGLRRGFNFSRYFGRHSAHIQKDAARLHHFENALVADCDRAKDSIIGDHRDHNVRRIGKCTI